MSEEIDLSKKLYELILEEQWYKSKTNDNFEKKINMPGILDALSVFAEENRLTHEIHNFLHYKNDEESLFYKDMWNAIYPSTHMNPHLEYNYEEWQRETESQ
ncbi:MAG: hypothetical protein FWC10_07480 [Lentimicrobiaceae bacterium]|nr:hypothetical protein [Lentimicrobiaceae bacterium]